MELTRIPENPDLPNRVASSSLVYFRFRRDRGALHEVRTVPHGTVLHSFCLERPRPILPEIPVTGL